MKTNKKMLVLDIDGTLVNDEKKITKKTLDRLKKMQKMGHHVVIATGRPTKGVKHIANKLDFDNLGGYVVSFNGSKVVNWQTEEVLFEQTLSHEDIPSIVEKARENNLGFVTYDKEHIVAGTEVDEFMDLEARINDIEIYSPENFEEYVDYDVNKCIVTCEPETAGEYEAKFKDMLKGKLDVYRSADFFIDIVPMGVDKYNAVSKLAKKLGVAHKDIICCGDSYNDISMIEGAGIGVAMENAVEEAKEVADFVTASNNDDGIALVIDKFIIGDRAAV